MNCTSVAPTLVSVLSFWGCALACVEAAASEPEPVETRTDRALPDPGQAATSVTREEIQLRLPRSAPDALRYEPGVYVQQTAHSQGSAYIRGRTGQQTVLLFDDVRLNNALFRQGPNQYFFTIDAATISRIDVTRGSASTRHGSDAIAGTLHARPIEPGLGKKGEDFALHPGVLFRGASADGSWGGRLQLDGHWGRRVGVFAGVGYRNVGQLESGGPIHGLTGGEAPEVPRFAKDGRTQLGTGFKEFTADLRAVAALSKKVRATLAYYDYRQFDAPRTDQCPPAYAPFDECLMYDEQFRTLVYGSLDGQKLGDWARRARLILSWQQQHERRTSTRPSSFVINGGRDDVNSFGLKAKAETRQIKFGEHVKVMGRYGADLYQDVVDSAAWIIFEDLDITRLRSRGQYLAGSTYTWGGAWGEGEVRLWDALHVRAGGRFSGMYAWAPADPESGTRGVDRGWTPVVGNIGVEWWASEWLTLLANMDGAFRAPNLDDMTSRQRTGPGFQLENPDLLPERGLTWEVGARVGTEWLDLDAWAYAASLEDAIARTTRDVDACPENGPEACRTTWSRLQLVNLVGTSWMLGAEGGARVKLPHNISLRATASFAWGDGPAPVQRASEDGEAPEREPLSRVPPLNGTLEALWRSESGFYLGSGFRWALGQDRLALQDVSDERIPRGGTPGFAVVDARLGWRGEHGAVNLVAENLTDAAYRYHGSSVNGPGRGVSVQVELGL